MKLSAIFHRWRGYVQALATFMTNPHLPNVIQGKLYTGGLKRICVPGLNCYSCPAAGGACPIGAFQAVVGAPAYRFSFYIVGILTAIGALLGRWICGFACPFGWFQDLLNKIPFLKRSTKKLKALTYVKYLILIGVVWLLGVLIVDGTGLSEPYFCKYICPQGILEGAIPLAIARAPLRSALGNLFRFKAMILLMVIVLSMVFSRPFCKWICPLGAFYSLFNRYSLYRFRVSARCVNCGKCARVCPMDVDITAGANQPECIRCGKCDLACPTGAIEAGWGIKPDNEIKRSLEQ